MDTKKTVSIFALSISMIFSERASATTTQHNDPVESVQEQNEQKSTPQTTIQKIEPFTGKITRNRVRLRSQPHLEASILKELQKDDCLIVNGMVDEFYAVKPPRTIKGYIYRTYVLDNHIEGNNVNVRLDPDISAAIITQMHSGEKVQGSVSSLNNKWFEIDLPDSVHFFVAKEFVNRIGDATVFTDIEKRKNQLDSRLVQIDGAMSEELKKPFKEVQLAPLAAQLHHIIEQNEDLPLYIERAEAMLHKMQEAYLQKSMAAVQADFPDTTIQISQETTIPEESIVPSTPETPVNETAPVVTSSEPANFPFAQAEAKRVQAAIANGLAQSEEEFYAQESKRSSRIKGVVKPFLRNVKNAPGDFMLVNTNTNVPTAFLFSSKVNLLELANKEVTITCVERPNNDYAFPAYFVIAVEK